jgi:hypothetical protein
MTQPNYEEKSFRFWEGPECKAALSAQRFLEQIRFGFRQQIESSLVATRNATFLRYCQGMFGNALF